MHVWQHINDMDHLRRRAESMIVSANGTPSERAASCNHRPTADDAHRLDLKDDLQNSPALADMSQ